jgi:diguanylate cyclase (GGDEF)-like protein
MATALGMPFSASLPSFSRGLVRTTDPVARYGGEEFAVILPRAPLGNALEIAERIRLAVQFRTWETPNSKPFGLTASFGIMDLRDGEGPVDLINRADQMLYDAKRRGREPDDDVGLRHRRRACKGRTSRAPGHFMK